MESLTLFKNIWMKKENGDTNLKMYSAVLKEFM